MHHIYEGVQEEAVANWLKPAGGGGLKYTSYTGIGVSMGVQNKPCVASSWVKDKVSCHYSLFSLSSACQDSLFTELGLYSDLVVSPTPGPYI